MGKLSEPKGPEWWAEQKFGRLILAEPRVMRVGEGRKTEWVCDCGKICSTKINHVTSGRISSCGKCNELSAEYFQNTKFGKLRMKDPVPSKPGSSKKVEWLCDCGKVYIGSVHNVTNGRSTSCGKCNLLTAEHFRTTKYGKLRMKNPIDLHPSSHKKVEWVCDCGKIRRKGINKVTYGETTSCNECNLMSAEWWASQKFGKLRMKEPKDLKLMSNERVWWICDCERMSKSPVCQIVSGKKLSCGKCSLLTAEHFRTTKYGRLRLKEPRDLMPGSAQKVEWLCDCGNETLIGLYSVTGNNKCGNTKSCGRCFEVALTWFKTHQEQLRSLQTPISPEHVPSGWIQLLEPVIRKRDKPKSLCGLCKKEYTPTWRNIISGISLTCGCSFSRVSAGQIEVFEFIKSLGYDAQLEFKVGKLVYDIAIPSIKVVVEYQGTRWHSSPHSKERDKKKLRNANENEWKQISIYEQKWTQEKEQSKQELQEQIPRCIIK